MEPIQVSYENSILDWPKEFMTILRNTIVGKRAKKFEALHIDNGIKNIVKDSTSAPDIDFDLEEFQELGLKALHEIEEDKILSLTDMQDAHASFYLKKSRIYNDVKDFTLKDVMDDHSKRQKIVGYSIGAPKPVLDEEGDEEGEPSYTPSRQVEDFGKDVPPIPKNRYPSLDNIRDKDMPTDLDIKEELVIASTRPLTSSIDSKSNHPTISFELPSTTEIHKKHLQGHYSNVGYKKIDEKFRQDFTTDSFEKKGDITILQKDIQQYVDGALVKQEFLERYVINKLMEEFKLKYYRHITEMDYPLDDIGYKVTFRITPRQILPEDKKTDIIYHLFIQSRKKGTFTITPFTGVWAGRSTGVKGIITDKKILEDTGNTEHEEAWNYYSRNKKYWDIKLLKEKKTPEEIEEIKNQHDKVTQREYGLSLSELEQIDKDITEAKQAAQEGQDKETKDKEYRYSPKLADAIDFIIDHYRDLENQLGA
jgi:hypothetical protein